MSHFSTISSNARKCLINLAVSPGRANFLKNSLIDLYENGQSVKLPLDKQSSAIGYKSDEPFFYNYIKYKEISNKSGSVTGKGQVSRKQVIDLYET